MKDTLIKLFWPILRVFEEGDGSYESRPMHRTILFVMGALFLSLSAISLYFSMAIGEVAGAVPVLAFLCIGGLCLIVGFLGSDRAVGRLWGRR